MKSVLAIVMFSWIWLPAHAAAEDLEASPQVSRWLDVYHRFDLEGFLDFYAADTRFIDPTARIDFTSRQQLRRAYMGIMQGRYGGNYKFDVNRMVTQENTVVLEGLFSLTWNGQKANINFTTWLEFKNGKITRQLDMFDYNSLQRQIPTFGQGLPSEYTGPRN